MRRRTRGARRSPATSIFHTCVSRTNRSSVAIGFPALARRKELLDGSREQDGSSHAPVDGTRRFSGALGGNQLRDGFAVLGNDDLFTRRSDPIHEVETRRLELACRNQHMTTLSWS